MPRWRVASLPRQQPSPALSEQYRVMITLFLIWASVKMRVLCLGTHLLSSPEGGENKGEVVRGEMFEC